MSPFRFHDDDSSTGTTVATALLGALAGFAVGMYVAQRVGGLNGLTKRFRRPVTADATGSQYPAAQAGQFDEVEDEIEDEAIGIGAAAADAALEDVDELEDDNVPLLEERVLEAFNNDPILAERAIDIGAIGETVVNRLLVDDEEHQLGDNLRRFKEGDAALADSRWEGQQVGTGKRRQGSSDEPDRHADPKPKLEDRWLSESEAVRNAADDIDEISAERRKGRGKSAKAPKADEAEPLA
jgi:hypothetical protein